MVLATVLVVIGPFARTLPAQEAETKSLSTLEKDLQHAMAARAYKDAGEIIKVLANRTEAKAVDILVKHALTGASYPIEKFTAAWLERATNPSVRAAVIEHCRKNPDYRVRITLHAVLEKWADDPKALQGLERAIEDPYKPVVFSALETLRRIKSEHSVDALIQELGKRERRVMDRVYFDVRKTLKAIAGVDLEVSADWKNYWEARKQGAIRPVEQKEGRTVLFNRNSFFSILVDSDRVLFVIDISGSMTEKDAPLPQDSTGEDDSTGGRSATVVGRNPPAPAPAPKPEDLPASRQRIYRVKEELVRVVEGLQPGVQFGIIAFNHQLQSLWPGNSLKPAIGSAKTSAVQWIRALRAEGATRTDLALKDALSVPEVDTIFMLTDGAPKDEKNRRLDIEPILATAQELNRFVRARIHTISFQQIRDTRMRQFVRQLSLQNDGGEPHLLP